MTAWLTLQHILVILPVVRAQRDAAHLGSEVFSAPTASSVCWVLIKTRVL